MSTKKDNTVELLLTLLKVKFTKKYVRKLYYNNPYRDTLFGISNILSEYNVRNKAFKIKNIEDFKSLEPPFVINLQGNIALVDKVTDNKVSCSLEDRDINLPFNKFREIWDGIILLPEATENSKEPEYKEHKIKHLFNLARKKLLAITSLLIVFAGFFINNLYRCSDLMFLFFISAIGIYTGYLLLQKQMHIHNNQADKICSIIKKGNCNSVLDSPAAKIMGVIGWSEIGLSYFISNIFITLFFPQLTPYMALINICALPYSAWSVWYQKYKVRQWCPLCLIIQVLLWITFVVNFVSGNIILPQFSVIEAIMTGCVYLLPLLIINTLLPKLGSENYIENLEQKIHDLRLNPGVLETLLKQQTHQHIDQSVSQIIWGKKDSNLLITVVTNPHCGPCAIIHNRIEKLLEKAGDKISVQYIFTSFDEKLESSSRFLASVYLSEEIASETKKEIYNEWFEKGKYNREDFFKEFNLDINKEEVITEISRHKQWNGLRDVYGTPTIFVNGYQLPDLYQIDDLIYFLDMKI